MDFKENNDGDFLIAQNYAIQLCADNIITPSDFLLYCFYRSLSGFKEIRCGYNYISINTGLSKGVISAGNSRLMEARLIRIKKYGNKQPFEVWCIPNNSLPRRKLKVVDRENTGEWVEIKEKQEVEQVAAFKRTTKYNLYDYKPSETILKFIDTFINEWCDRNKTGFYYKNDYKKLEEIDVEDAMKYIPVLWSLDSVDDWVRDSDHVISVFVELYKQGKLQNHYPKTKYFYIDRQNKEEEE